MWFPSCENCSLVENPFQFLTTCFNQKFNNYKSFIMKISEEIIRDIAQTLDMGEVVYLHKTTHERLSYPDTNDSEFEYLEEEVREIVDADPENYIRFEPPESRESYRFMEDFAEMQPTDLLRARLLDSLQAKRPFRAFRDAVDGQGLLDAWYAFKEAQLTMLVRDQLPD